MNGIKIIEENDTANFTSMPILYRVSIHPNIGSTKYPLIIKREFFRVGFRDGEMYDKYFFSEGEGVDYASIITKRINDKDYLIEIEKILISKYIEECKNSVEFLDNLLRKETFRITQKRNEYLKISRELSNMDRNKKLKKVLSHINEKIT
jgi:hypothetical protein